MNEEPHAKSHEEILQLLQELETVEEQLKHPQTLQPTSETVEIPLPEEQTEAPEWQSVEDKPKKQKKRLFKHKTTTREDFEEHVENFLASPEKKTSFQTTKTYTRTRYP